MTVTHTGDSHLDFGYQIRGELEQSLVTAAHSDWHGEQMRHRRTGRRGADRGICFFCLFGVIYFGQTEKVAQQRPALTPLIPLSPVPGGCNMYEGEDPPLIPPPLRESWETRSG